MARRLQRLVTAFACMLIVALSLGLAVAADKGKLDDATNQVAEGARSVGYGEFGSGFADIFVGIGRTIVEGTVYTGKTIGEFVKNTLGD